VKVAHFPLRARQCAKPGPAPAKAGRALTTTRTKKPENHPRVCSKEDDLTNPFEDENGIYHVLINDEGQHSLWPSFIDVPKGWTIIHESDSRAACLEFITNHWTDMRPNSLIESMKALAEQQPASLPDQAARSQDDAPPR
jgi:MbtH protein